MYLIESRLGEFLKKLYPNHEFIHDKIVPNLGINNRPDYRNDELKLIVEFDGYQHYTSSSYILTDQKKDEIYSGAGYRIIRIPYFVQLSTDVIQNLFEIDFIINQVYPHGFIDKKAILPADFCELGIHRFKSDLERFSFIKQEIIQSLNAKVAELITLRLVFPPSLDYIYLNTSKQFTI